MDISVPNVIILVIYRLVAITENPHCGIMPNRAPIRGPTLLAFVIMFLVFFCSLCSNSSIIMNVISKKGISFIESNIVSIIISFISSSFFFIIALIFLLYNYTLYFFNSFIGDFCIFFISSSFKYSDK